MRDSLERAVPAAALTLATAVVLTIGLELSHAATGASGDPFGHVNALPIGRLALNCLVVWAVVALVQGVTGRFLVTGALSLAAGVVIAFADVSKMRLRDEPVYPTDVSYLRDLGLLLDSAGVDQEVAIVVGALLVGGVAVSLLRRLRSVTRRRLPGRLPSYVARATTAVLAVGALVVAAGFNEPGNALREVYERTDPVWLHWDQPRNYATNGFLAGTLYNLPASPMQRPAGYDEKTMDEIADRYGELASAINAGRNPDALRDTNVVIVLNETFADPSRLPIRMSEDPIPFTRSLMENNTSGSTVASGYGGGTANVEFEVLTGMAQTNFRPQLHTPFQTLLPHHATFPSFVRSLGDGRQTLSVHPFVSTFYRRDAVYPALGFDRSKFRDDMKHTGRISDRGQVSDAATYDEVVAELRAAGEPMLVNVVTMQNHRPYSGLYSDPVAVEGEMSDAERAEIGQYLRGLRHSDQAIEQLVSDLEQMDERTIVLLYGDHLASLWPESVKAAVPEQTLFETPYVVWANFPTRKLDTAPTLGPNFLVNQMLAAADAPITPFNALLAELENEVSAVERTLTLGPDGQQIAAADLPPRALELLEDYQMVQYDLAVGRRYAEAALFDVPPVD
ncbi:LTA synthase family protein [Georgenia sp. EYE_87]|uniref:LTA synthase family protein n=1 Tax=Georgenia sp. EYE_87 TaxID=2853448 RepID=UPI0020061BC4|nr:LTA synthase family protein [Georgenia sp. EYE_87]MCK6211741.1 LTA synthase family protein [Georgenia sp. EYE_87]